MEKPDNLYSIRDEFAVHMLNDNGKARAAAIAEAFSECLARIESLTAREPAADLPERDKRTGNNARELAIVRTKLQEANFFAKRAIAVLPENQEHTIDIQFRTPPEPAR